MLLYNSQKPFYTIGRALNSRDEGADKEETDGGETKVLKTRKWKKTPHWKNNILDRGNLRRDKRNMHNDWELGKKRDKFLWRAKKNRRWREVCRKKKPSLQREWLITFYALASRYWFVICHTRPARLTQVYRLQQWWPILADGNGWIGNRARETKY